MSTNDVTFLLQIPNFVLNWMVNILTTDHAVDMNLLMMDDRSGYVSAQKTIAQFANHFCYYFAPHRKLLKYLSGFWIWYFVTQSKYYWYSEVEWVVLRSKQLQDIVGEIGSPSGYTRYGLYGFVPAEK